MGNCFIKGFIKLCFNTNICPKLFCYENDFIMSHIEEYYSWYYMVFTLYMPRAVETSVSNVNPRTYSLPGPRGRFDATAAGWPAAGAVMRRRRRGDEDDEALCRWQRGPTGSFARFPRFRAICPLAGAPRPNPAGRRIKFGPNPTKNEALGVLGARLEG